MKTIICKANCFLKFLIIQSYVPNKVQDKNFIQVFKSVSITITEQKEREQFNTEHYLLLKRPTWRQDLKHGYEYEELDFF